MILRSPSTPTEVLRRIETGLASPGALLTLTSGTGGRVSADGFVLHYQRALIHNSFAPICEGRVTADQSGGGGSRIDLRFRFHPFSLVFIVGMPVGMAVIALGVVAMSFGQVPGTIWPDWRGVWERLDEVRGFLPFGVLFGLIGDASWRFDRPHILAYVRQAAGLSRDLPRTTRHSAAR